MSAEGCGVCQHCVCPPRARALDLVGCWALVVPKVLSQGVSREPGCEMPSRAVAVSCACVA
eukprot:150000-Pyramimonas_sp.AAC.1